MRIRKRQKFGQFRRMFKKIIPIKQIWNGVPRIQEKQQSVGPSRHATTALVLFQKKELLQFYLKTLKRHLRH